MNITILGAGLVGSAIADDLAADGKFKVTSVDLSAKALSGIKNPAVTKIEADVLESGKIDALLADADIAINAVPGFMGFEVLQRIIETKTDVVDIAFYPENPLDLDSLAKQNNVTAIVDCGVSPGINNLISGRMTEEFDKLNSIKIFVGGLPQKPEGLFDYQAVFSPSDVIEEYTRPARIIENGEIVIKPALSEAETLRFDPVGELEAFNSDGLRTVLETIDCPNMVEKTLRYPGHVERMKGLREYGFFNSDKIDFNGTQISPLDMAVKVLTKTWKSRPESKDLTVFRVEVNGEKNGTEQNVVFDLFDKFDEATGTRSMARTTGYTAAMAVRAIAGEVYTVKGISPPEFLGEDEKTYQFILDGLKERNINLIRK